MSKDKKIKVLKELMVSLNAHNVTWAIGGSLLLYFKGISKEFNDIDIMVDIDDIKTINQVFGSYDSFKVNTQNDQFKTKFYCEFIVEGVDVDIMAGFAIAYNQTVYDCSLDVDKIEYIMFDGIEIPLQSVDDWRRYYELMNRYEKVEMIDEKFKTIIS